MADTYTRFILTVIALALVAIAAQLGASPFAAAHADSPQLVRLDGPVELGNRTLQVEVKQDYSTAGSNSGHPLYVQVAQ